MPGVDVKQFVSETLVQLLAGINAAQEAHPGRISGKFDYGAGQKMEGVIFSRINQQPPQFLVEFDIAITVAENQESERGGKLQVAWLGIGGGSKDANRSESTSRIKFKIPVIYTEDPHHPVTVDPVAPEKRI